ncbi:MAG: nucleotidyltransferase family protein [Anaerolineales bacterium]
MVNAVVTAGGLLTHDDPLVEFLPENSPQNKVFLLLDGKPVLQWVLDALTATDRVEQIIVVGRSSEEGWTSTKPLIFLPDQGGLIENAIAGLSHSARISPEESHSLIISGDIPLLESRMVNWVLDHGLPQDADLLFHVVPDTLMEEQFPGSNRTYTPLKDARVCGADVHLVAHRVIDSHFELWKKLAAARKSPLKLASVFGPGMVLSILMKRYELKELADVLSRRLNLDAQADFSPFAAMGMDVDKPNQYQLVSEELKKMRVV